MTPGGLASRTVHLFKDMSARDLLLRRSTNREGDTIWEPAPLVRAALNGELVVLDGLHRLLPDTLSVRYLAHSENCSRNTHFYVFRHLIKTPRRNPLESNHFFHRFRFTRSCSILTV